MMRTTLTFNGLNGYRDKTNENATNIDSLENINKDFSKMLFICQVLGSFIFAKFNSIKISINKKFYKNKYK